MQQAPAKIVAEVSKDLFERIVSKCPTDTGYTRANFQLTADTPATGTIGEKPKQHGKLVFAKPETPELPEGTTRAWIVNNTPESELLEHGRSDQAPSGMIAISIAEIEQEFSAIAERALKK